MADFIGKNEVHTVEEYDLYCHYVAGLVGSAVAKVLSNCKQNQFKCPCAGKESSPHTTCTSSQGWDSAVGALAHRTHATTHITLPENGQQAFQWACNLPCHPQGPLAMCSSPAKLRISVASLWKENLKILLSNAVLMSLLAFAHDSSGCVCVENRYSCCGTDSQTWLQLTSLENQVCGSAA